MNVQQTVDWVYKFLSNHGNLPGTNRDLQITLDIFDNGLIDSFGIVELISEVEAKFKIELKSEDIEDTRFRTIRGLAEIIGEHMNRS